MKYRKEREGGVRLRAWGEWHVTKRCHDVQIFLMHVTTWPSGAMRRWNRSNCKLGMHSRPPAPSCVHNLGTHKQFAHYILSPEQSPRPWGVQSDLAIEGTGQAAAVGAQQAMTAGGQNSAPPTGLPGHGAAGFRGHYTALNPEQAESSCAKPDATRQASIQAARQTPCSGVLFTAVG